MPFQPRLQRDLSKIFERHFTAAERTGVRKLTESQDVTPIQINVAQDVLRPLYGKDRPVKFGIGDHPEFEHLKSSNGVEFGPTTTMFVDIEGSTRLGLLYPLEKVFLFKNALIQSAIDIVNAFDGHVHRIMGDAVMAFFGSKNDKPENGIVDGLNCVSFLGAFIEESVIPKLREYGYEGDFGVRIGLDFGPKDDVLWGSYGYRGMNEVTATSFFVDAAAKLQQSASRNGIIIGDSLRNEIDFPQDLVEVPTRVRDGEEERDYYLRPNHLDANGNPINYKKHILRSSDYLACSPLAPLSSLVDRSRIGVAEIRAELYRERNGTFIKHYKPASEVLGKNRWLKFTYRLLEEPAYPYTVHISVENHGQEAKDDEALKYSKPPERINSREDSNNFAYWRQTKYRGLHYLNLEIQNSEGLQYRGRFGVFVE